MSAITTHVLDTARGKPAANIEVTLERFSPTDGWRLVATARTDAEGRVRDGLAPAAGVDAATYRLRFETESYFKAQQTKGFYPEVSVTFVVRNAAEHHHVPLLLSPFGYSTYRGS
jgi:5-hydroxyisourate hydrolase